MAITYCYGPSIIRVPRGSRIRSAATTPISAITRDSSSGSRMPTPSPARGRSIAGGGAGQRDGVLPSPAGSSRRPDRSVLHPRGLSRDLRGRHQQAAGDVDARVVDRGSALAGGRRGGARMGAAAMATVSSPSRACRPMACISLCSPRLPRSVTFVSSRSTATCMGWRASASCCGRRTRSHRSRAVRIRLRTVPTRTAFAMSPRCGAAGPCTCSSPGSATRPSG